nr:MAG TPA: hypothetical protein [Caudoviricetes sp.]
MLVKLGVFLIAIGIAKLIVSIILKNRDKK